MPHVAARRHNKSHRHAADSQQPACNNLFAACLPRWLDNTQLLSVFAAFEPTSATIMMDVNTGRSKGFGFVLFRSNEEGQRALNALNGKSVSCGGATFAMYLSPSKFDGFAACAESTRIYVRNVPWAMCADEVVEYFSRHGAVKAIEMRPDATESSWLVTLEYSSIAEAKTAINHSHGKLLFPDLASTPIMAKFADNTDKQQARRRKKSDLNVVLPAATKSKICEPLLVKEGPMPLYADAAASICGQSSSSNSSGTPRASPSEQDSPISRVYRHDPYSLDAFLWL